MAGSRAAAATVRGVADRLQGSALVDDKLVGLALARWLDGDASLDEALGLAPGWRRHVATRERDAALVEIAMLLPDVSAHEIGRLVAAHLRRDFSWNASVTAARQLDLAIGRLRRTGCRLSVRRIRALVAPWATVTGDLAQNTGDDQSTETKRSKSDGIRKTA